MTDQPQAVSEPGDVVFVKHKVFTYKVPVLDSDGNQVIAKDKRGNERPRTSIRHAMRFQAINMDDLPEEEYQRGEALGAFFSDNEVAAMRSGGTPNGNGEAEGETAPVSGLNYDSHDELVAWIRDSRPTTAAVVAAAEGDPDKAEALLAAEEEATGGQPRKGVTDGLNRIMSQ